LFSSSVYSGNAWYAGVVKTIAFYDTNGSFVLTFDSNSLDDCLYKYVYVDYKRLMRINGDRFI